MNDPRLAAVFLELNTASPVSVDREALSVAIDRANRRRRWIFAGAVGAAALLVAIPLLVPGSQRESLVPVRPDPTPSQTYTLAAQPGRISFLPRNCVNVRAPAPPGVSHYEIYGVPHAHANKKANPNDGDVIRFAANLHPSVPPGAESGDGTRLQLTHPLGTYVDTEASGRRAPNGRYNIAEIHALGTYYAPSGRYNVAVIRWFDGVYNYRLQAPILSKAQATGLTYEELLQVANSVPQGTPEVTRAEPPQPLPSGYLATPGPNVLRYWSTNFYATKPSADAHPKVTAEQALATERSTSSQGAQLAKTPPHAFLAQVSVIAPAEGLEGEPWDYRDRLAWVIEYTGIADDTEGLTHTNCTAIYLVDAATGEPLRDVISCPPIGAVSPTGRRP